MSHTKLLVQWYDSKGNLTELDGIRRINITKGRQSNINTADIYLNNPLVERGYDNLLYAKYVDPVSGVIKFSECDTIKIYLARVDDNTAIDTSTGSSDLVMSAEIQDISPDSSESSSQIKLGCVDKTYVLFNVLWSNTYLTTDTINTAPEIVQNLVRSASSMSGLTNQDGFDSTGDVVLNGPYQVDARLDNEANSDSEYGFIETTRPDSSAFPSITMGKAFKPVWEWLDEISTKEYTNDFDGSDSENDPIVDRTMFYYVDERNRFHWFYPKDEVTTTLSTAITQTETITTIDVADASSLDTVGQIQIGGELFDYTGITSNQLTGVTRQADNTSAEAHSIGDTVYSTLVLTEQDTSTGNTWLGSKLKLSTTDIINSIIFNAGDDMDGSGIVDLWFDPTTESAKLNQVYKDWSDISRELKREELRKGGELGDTTITHTDGDTYAYPANYGDYGAGKDLPHWNPGDSTIVSDATFNTSLRTAVEDRAKARAKQLTASKGHQRWKGPVTLLFRRFRPGKLVKVKSPSTGIRNKYLRIQKVQYNLSKESSRTTLTLEEDEKREGEL